MHLRGSKTTNWPNFEKLKRQFMCHAHSSTTTLFFKHIWLKKMLSRKVLALYRCEQGLNLILKYYGNDHFTLIAKMIQKRINLFFKIFQLNRQLLIPKLEAIECDNLTETSEIIRFYCFFFPHLIND